MATWPSTLYPPSINGFSLEPKNVKDSMEMEYGRLRHRNLSQSYPYILNCQFNFKYEDYQTFIQFFKFDIGNGVGFFEMDWLSCFGIAGTYESRFLEPERVLNGYRANFSAVLLAQEQSQIPPIDETWPQSVV